MYETYQVLVLAVVVLLSSLLPAIAYTLRRFGGWVECGFCLTFLEAVPFSHRNGSFPSQDTKFLTFPEGLRCKFGGLGFRREGVISDQSFSAGPSDMRTS